MQAEERAFADARRHAIYQIAHAPLRAYPFPHVFVEDILPAGFYRRLLANLPGIRAYDRDEGATAEHVEGRRSIKGARRGCNRMDAERAGFWTAAFEAFDHVDFGGWLTAKFYETISERLGLGNAAAHTDLDTRVSLVRDRSPAPLQPHASVPGRVLTAMFQLAPDDRRVDLGTALYMPREGAPMPCPGAGREAFDLVTTLPFRPNSLLAFPETEASFRGFEPTRGTRIRRDMMLLSLDLPTPVMH